MIINTYDKFHSTCISRINLMKKLEMVAIKLSIIFKRMRNRFESRGRNSEFRLILDTGVAAK